MTDFDALLLAVVLGLATTAALAACGVLQVRLARPSGAQRKAWRDSK